ncbi:MAG: APC family permease [Gemmatimonadaceae bacterium]
MSGGPVNGPAATAATSTTGVTPVVLPRALGLRDLVLLNVVGIISLRWLATSAAAGPSVLSLWVLAALLFFVPLGLAVSDLSARYPHEGGVYAWTKAAFGEGHGFLCGWCYWVNNLLYYPNLLIASAVMATYAIGKGGSGLENDWTYVLTATLVMLWFATFVNIIGLGTGKWLQNVGAICLLAPGAVLLVVGVMAMVSHPAANPISWSTVVPDLGQLSELNLWASIAFAFTGIELGATMSDEIDNPSKTLPRSVLLSAPIVVGLYLLGTISVLWILPSKDVNVVSGFLQALQAGLGGSGTTLRWLVSLCALLYVVGNLGGVGAWLVGPSRVAFVIGLDRYFPPAFGRVHPKWKTPYVAILVQSSFATLFLLLSVLGKGTTVANAYLILLDTMILIYFIPFLYLFLVYLTDKGIRASAGQPGGVSRLRVVGLGVSGMALTTFAMIVACVPPSDTPSVVLFELKVVGGALLFVLFGGVLYWRAGRRGATA